MKQVLRMDRRYVGTNKKENSSKSMDIPPLFASLAKQKVDKKIK